MEETLRRRNKASQGAGSENLAVNQEDEKKLQEVPRKTLKYYFNRFRYYHYCFAEKVDNMLGIVCFAIIKVYFFLVGYEQRSLQGDEATNVMGMDDDPFD